MNISQQELNRRLAEADRRRVALRRATLELAALGRQLLAQRSKRERDGMEVIKRELGSLAKSRITTSSAGANAPKADSKVYSPNAAYRNSRNR